MKYAYLLILVVINVKTHGDIYKCLDSSGSISYQANPCAEETDAISFTPKAIETKYKSIPSFSVSESKSSDKNHEKTSCPYIPSYELRNLRVKDKYMIGMKKQDIRKRLGQPTSMKKNQWTYLGNHVNRTFNFKKGCLTQWKEKWKGKESQISKYRN